MRVGRYGGRRARTRWEETEERRKQTNQQKAERPIWGWSSKSQRITDSLKFAAKKNILEGDLRHNCIQVRHSWGARKIKLACRLRTPPSSEKLGAGGGLRGGRPAGQTVAGNGDGKGVIILSLPPFVAASLCLPTHTLPSPKFFHFFLFFLFSTSFCAFGPQASWFGWGCSIGDFRN